MSALMHFRRRKDEFFKHDPHSPLTPEQQELFEGLAYYPENADLRLELEVQIFDQQSVIAMQTSTGGVAEFIRWGRIAFQVEGQAAELTVYVSRSGQSYFLPFMDATSGVETYEAGRYLEPEPLPDGRLLVDFNLAYNPYCAYNEPEALASRVGRAPQIWTCPIPPLENRLVVPIKAGEKKPVGNWVAHS